jgi:H+/Cl- antiporter ClcA/predicted transcriptional regulator
MTGDRIPVAPGLTAAMDRVPSGPGERRLGSRVLWISALAVVLAAVVGFTARFLTQSIHLLTNLSFMGRWSTADVRPGDLDLGWWLLLVPFGGGLLVGLLARYGSAAIRGHGIPEAMEQVLLHDSRIPYRMVLLKPISAAISIGTGGPFGAEGPIIATGGALGSALGQVLRITAEERKILLAAGAAAGMAATFGTPLSAVLLAVELLLFEYRARSFLPVALASIAGTAVRAIFAGAAPAFHVQQSALLPGLGALAACLLVGAVAGLGGVLVSKAVYAVEEAFERLPIHWMWWPAIGGLFVGIIGMVSPRTLGVGYDNIEAIVSGNLPLAAIAVLAGWKFVSWAIALGSGTSGGTLAPLLTLGGALGAVLGAGLAYVLPGAHLDPRLAALAGMAALFASAARAPLTSVIFAVEATHQPDALMPILAAGAVATLVASMLSRHSIMTEKLARRGAHVPGGFSADHLEQVLVRDACARPVVSLQGDSTVEEIQAWLEEDGAAPRHQGFPVVDDKGSLLGMITRREILAASSGIMRDLMRRPQPVVVREDQSLREAADLMVVHHVGRLPVVRSDETRSIVGILTRSDLLAAHHTRLRAEHVTEGLVPLPELPVLRLPNLRRRR